jgi:hypothetical protein
LCEASKKLSKPDQEPFHDLIKLAITEKSYLAYENRLTTVAYLSVAVGASHYFESDQEFPINLRERLCSDKAIGSQDEVVSKMSAQLLCNLVEK